MATSKAGNSPKAIEVYLMHHPIIIIIITIIQRMSKSPNAHHVQKRHRATGLLMSADPIDLS